MPEKRGSSETGFFAQHKLWVATTTFIGTIVGAGILALPYLVAKAGFLFGVVLMLILGVAFLFLNLFVGEIVLRTKGQHQLTGYAEKYLGIWGKRITTFTMVFGIYGALTAYLIGEGEALYTFFHLGSPLLWSAIFFAVGLLIAYRGMKSTGKVELVLIFFLITAIALVGIFSWKNIVPERLLLSNFSRFLFPYGAILFSYMGFSAIPEMQEILEKDRKQMKKAIIVGSIIPIILYIIFSFFVIGLVGLENFEALAPNERIATIALSFYSSPLLGIFVNLIAVLTMFTSFLTLSIALEQMYVYDYAFPRRTALLLTFFLPLMIAFLGLATFLDIITITGVLAGGLQGILFVMMYWRAKKQGERTPEYTLPLFKPVGWFLIFLFVLGIAYEIFRLFF